MIEEIKQLFADDALVERIKTRLPQFFHIAALESSRAGKIGMEVGMIRERIIAALLIYKFGGKDVITYVPTTESEVDVYLHNKPISIKTLSGANVGGVKLIWTVDAQKAFEFSNNYNPSCDMIFVHIVWGGNGGMFYIPVEIQREVLGSMGKENYIKLPRPGTNPRGVEMQGAAMKRLIAHPQTISFQINWQRDDIEFNAFNRWVEMWSID